METTDYSNGFVYKVNHLDHMLTEDGRLKHDELLDMYHYEYFLK